VEPRLPISTMISIKISITIYCTMEHPLNAARGQLVANDVIMRMTS